jgi:hypothetical protein
VVCTLKSVAHDDDDGKFSAVPCAANSCNASWHRHVGLPNTSAHYGLAKHLLVKKTKKEYQENRS